MRLFIAFDISNEVKNYLKLVQTLLPDVDSKLTKSFHLTLRFLGECSEQETEKIKKQLKQIQFNPFSAHTTNLGVFPNENFIKVVWIGIEPGEIIIKIKEQLEKVLKLQIDARFHPHITLQRIKFLKNKKEYLGKLKKIPLKEQKFYINSIKLIKSELTPQGPIYKVIEEINSI